MSLSITGPDGVSIAVTDVSTATPIAADVFGASCTEVLVQNTGNEPCYIRAGHADVQATPLSVLMPPQWRETFAKGSATHLAARCASGKTTTLVVAPVGES